jgi:hypothetical protein
MTIKGKECISWFNYPHVKSKLLNYEDNTLSDLKAFITPDSIDEFNFYTFDNYSLDDLFERTFKEWHNISKTLRIRLKLHISN